MPKSDKAGETAQAAPKVATRKKTAPKKKPKSKRLPPYNVVLLNDDDHTYEYVIEMLGKVFGYDKDRGYQLAKEVDSSGRVILLTTHKELAELKCDQVTGYGADWRLEQSKGAMSAVVEPSGG